MKKYIGKFIGKYQIVDRIGRGGTASVFKAVNPDTGLIVAIKVLSPTAALDENFARRFRREFQMVTELRHPNIVPVLDFGSIGDSAFLVMPYYPNGSLADRLKERMLTPAEGARLINEISAALDFAHTHGVVHRDLKPGNILFDEHNKAILTDFGMAHYHEASINITGSAVVGTPAYISPEQARGETIDHRTDQYAFGVILYQLVTNELPFEADTPIAVLIKHLNDPLPPPRTKNEKVPEIVERVILKATAKDRRDRFDSITEFNSIFQSALAHAIDPTTTPAPMIELPEYVYHQSGMITKELDMDGVARKRKRRLAVIFATIALLALIIPIGAMAIIRYLGDAGDIAGGQSAEAFSVEQTALAGTIEVLSTELANRDEQLSDEDIFNAVMGTLSVDQDDGESGIPAGNESSEDIIGVTGLEFTPTPTIDAASTAEATYALTPTDSGGDGSATVESTFTPIPMHTGSPTATPTETPPDEPTATDTDTPTETPLPTDTPTGTPTNTPIPPTPTNTPVTYTVCSLIGFSGSGDTWTISNNGSVDIYLTAIDLTWAEGNGNLTKIKLLGTIWTGSHPPTSASFSESELGNRNGRKISSGQAENLVFTFENGGSVNTISINIDNGDDGCEKP